MINELESGGQKKTPPDYLFPENSMRLSEWINGSLSCDPVSNPHQNRVTQKQMSVVLRIKLSLPWETNMDKYNFKEVRKVHIMEAH